MPQSNAARGGTSSPLPKKRAPPQDRAAVEAGGPDRPAGADALRERCLAGSDACAALARRIDEALARKNAEQRLYQQRRQRPHASASVAAAPADLESETVAVRTRHLAAKYVLAEVQALSGRANPSTLQPAGVDGVPALCAKKVVECDELCSRVAAAVKASPAAPHAGLVEAARRLVTVELGRPYEECCAAAGAHLRPLLAARVEQQAELCAGILSADALNMAEEAAALLDERAELRTAATAEQAEQVRLRERLNRQLSDAVRRMGVLLTQYRVPSEQYDGHMAQHLLALLEALQAKLQVLCAEAETHTYTVTTIPALRSLRDMLQELLGSGGLEGNTLKALSEQYGQLDSDPEVKAEFKKINEECRALEREKMHLERELQA